MMMLKMALKILTQPMRLNRRIKRLAAYVRRLGLIGGAVTLFKGLTAKDGTFCVRVPQARDEITLRGGTSDLAVFEQIFVWADYDLAMVAEPRLIIDGGANIGCAAVYFAIRYPDARIIAVEPDAANFKMLAHNTSPYANVSLMQAGIWHKRVELKIENPDEESWMFRVHESEPSPDTIASVTIAELFSESGASSIDLLKLDIEGAEREVFSFGYQQWLDQVKVLVIELHERYKPGCEAAFYAAIANYDFSQTRRGENLILVNRRPARAAI